MFVRDGAEGKAVVPDPWKDKLHCTFVRYQQLSMDRGHHEMQIFKISHLLALLFEQQLWIFGHFHSEFLCDDLALPLLMLVSSLPVI